MKSKWMLAAVASLAACAGRGEDDMGAAPDRGDTTAVTTGADTTTMDTLNTGGMAPDTSTSNVETAPTTPADTTGQSGAYPSDTSATNPSGGYETTPPSADSSTSVPSADPGMTPTDTSSAVPSDTTLPSDTGVPSDSGAAAPTDSAVTPQ
jgi:hypothetical protein